MCLDYEIIIVVKICENSQELTSCVNCFIHLSSEVIWRVKQLPSMSHGLLLFSQPHWPHY